MEKIILEHFHSLALPAKDKKGGPKVDAILKSLKDQKVKSEYIPGIGIIANQLEAPKVILVSHFDLIRKFRKTFKAGGYQLEVKEEEDLVVGALDNTITNATILAILDKIDLSSVEILFSEGEEVGYKGMIKYLSEHKERVKDCFFVNLDVTNEGFKDSHSSFEYDEPNFEVIKAVQAAFIDADIHYTGDRVCDDTDAIIEADCHGVSFCLPTSGEIHSLRNSAKLSALKPYAESLAKLLEMAIDFTDKKSDFSHYMLKKALECATREEFDKLPKRTTSSWSGWGTQRNFDFDDYNHSSRSTFGDKDWEEEMWEEIESASVDLPPWDIEPTDDNIDWDLATAVTHVFYKIYESEGDWKEMGLSKENVEMYGERMVNYLHAIAGDKTFEKSDLEEMFDYNFLLLEVVMASLLERGIVQEIKSSFDKVAYTII